MSPHRPLEHPSDFPSMLRRQEPPPPVRMREGSQAREGREGSQGREWREGSQGSQGREPPKGRGPARDWSRDSARLSVDSLDSRRNSWDPGRFLFEDKVLWHCKVFSVFALRILVTTAQPMLGVLNSFTLFDHHQLVDHSH